MQFPNLETELVCSKIEDKYLTVGDVKGPLLEGIPIEVRTTIYSELLKSAITRVDWEFVKQFLKEKDVQGTEGEGQ